MFWDMMPCYSVDRYQCCGGVCCCHLQGRRVSLTLKMETEHLPSSNLLPVDQTTQYNISEDINHLLIFQWKTWKSYWISGFVLLILGLKIITLRSSYPGHMRNMLTYVKFILSQLVNEVSATDVIHNSYIH